MKNKINLFPAFLVVCGITSLAMSSNEKHPKVNHAKLTSVKAKKSKNKQRGCCAYLECILRSLAHMQPQTAYGVPYISPYHQ